MLCTGDGDELDGIRRRHLVKHLKHLCQEIQRRRLGHAFKIDLPCHRIQAIVQGDKKNPSLDLNRRKRVGSETPASLAISLAVVPHPAK